LLNAALGVQADAPGGEHVGQGLAEYRAGGGHRERFGGVDVDADPVPHTPAAQQGVR
jgi:hypothetical protein